MGLWTDGRITLHASIVIDCMENNEAAAQIRTVIRMDCMTGPGTPSLTLNRKFRS